MRRLVGPCVLLAIAAAAATSGRAQGPPRLLADVEAGAPRGGGSGGSDFHPVVGGVVFVAFDDPCGREIWFSDGDSAVLARDVAPGRDRGVSVNTFGAQMTSLGGIVLFAGCTGGGDLQEDLEPWRTDGTFAGTWRVADAVPGVEGSDPEELTTIGALAYFSASTPDGGREPWRTDETAAGTFAVGDVAPGLASSSPWSFTEAPGGRCVFAATTTLTGQEPFVSDGRAAALLVDIEPGAAGSSPGDFHFDGTRTWFRARTSAAGHEPWVTDGTAAGTRQVVDLFPGATGSAPRSFATMGGVTYFVADGPGEVDALHASDGTAGGTRLVHGVRVLSPNLVPLDGLLVFSGTSGATSDGEPWASDGTSAGTVPLRTHALGSDGLRPEAMTWAGDHVFFVGNDDGVTGKEPWRTDGTPAGTRLIDDLEPGPASSVAASGLASAWRAQGLTWFSACTPFPDCEPWRTDGTAAGTRRVADLRLPSSPSAPVPLANVEGHLLFSADTRVVGREPWISDGTTAGTRLLADLYPPVLWAPEALGLLAGEALFTGRDALWATDALGTPPRRVADLWGNVSGDSPLSVPVAGGLAIEVQSPDDSAPRVSFTDGETGVVGLAPEQFGAFSFRGLLGRAGDLALFIAHGPEGLELHATDGTPGGTAVIDVVPGADGLQSNAGVELGARLLVDGEDGVGPGLFVSDGTLAGTQRLAAARALVDGPAWHRAWRLGVAMDGGALLVADGGDGDEPWLSDGTPAGTAQLADLWPGAGGSRPCWLTSLGDVAIFAATTPDTGSELFVTDGTPAGTRLLADLVPGVESSWPRDLVSLGPEGPVVFVAHTPGEGREAWVTDGTRAGTVALPEAVAGPEHVDPRHLIAFGRHVAFDGQGPEGSEPWILDVPWSAEAGNCRDDVDNDLDLLVDCADGECAITPTCDRDLDGVLDVDDCAPRDAGSQQAPAEIADLRASLEPGRTGVRLDWTDPRPGAGTGTVSDVAADALAVLSGAGAAAAPCVVRDLVAPSWSDSSAGSRYILVRARNACGPTAGEGWGRDSLGAPRPACP